ncbi:MAG: hypothetical protein O3B24_05785 [Verrucomicrobia bacterium]|nr:hypothetical protein [Verrucomicrobiota bacterium]
MSVSVVTDLLNGSVGLLDHLAYVPEFPFSQKVDQELATKVQQYWEDMSGGWDG